VTGPAIRGKQAAGDREDSSAGRELTDASDVQSLALILNGYSRAGFALEYTSMQASVSAGGRAAGRARERGSGRGGAREAGAVEQAAQEGLEAWGNMRELVRSIVENAKIAARQMQETGKEGSGAVLEQGAGGQKVRGAGAGGRGGERNAQSWALLLNGLAAFQERDRELIIRATREIVSGPSSALTAQDVANVVNALDRLDTWPEGMSVWAAEVASSIPGQRFNLKEITALWGTAASRLASLQHQMLFAPNATSPLSVQDVQGAQRLCNLMAECALRLSDDAWTPQGAALVMNSLSRNHTGTLLASTLTREVLARVSRVVCLDPRMYALQPYEASLMMNALARTGTLDVPLLLRLGDALRRSPRGSWATQDIVRVADSFVRLQLHEIDVLMDLELLERLKEELLAMSTGELGGRALASLANAANNISALDDARVWQRLADEADDTSPHSYSEDSISLLASVLTRPATARSSSSSSDKGAGGGDRTPDVGEEVGRPQSGSALGPLDYEIASRLYQKLLDAVVATQPDKFRWETLGFLVMAERQHRRTGRSMAQTPTSSIELAVLSALRSFQGASLLSMVAQSLKVAAPPPHSPHVVTLLVRLCTAMAYAPAGVLSDDDGSDVFRRLRLRLLEVPPRSLSADDIATLIRAFVRAGPRFSSYVGANSEDGVGLDGELMRRFAWEIRNINSADLQPRQAVSLLSALGGGGLERGRGMVGVGGLEKDNSSMSLVRVLSKYIRALAPGTLLAGELALVLSSLAAMRIRDGALFRYASANILAMPSSAFSAVDVSTIVNSYSRVGVWDEKVFRHLSSAARQLRPIYLQDAAIICEAFSCAETRTGSSMRDGALFRHISHNLQLPDQEQKEKRKADAEGAPAAGSGVGDRNGLGVASGKKRHASRMLAGLLNAFARSNVWDEVLFHRVSQTIRALRPRDVPVQDIAAIVNAFARACTRHNSTFRNGALFLHLSRIAQDKDAAEFRARDVANIVNALARVGVWDEVLFRKMSTVVRGMSAKELPLRDAARIVCAFTLATTREGSRLRDGSLFRHVSDISISVLAGDDLSGAGVSAADIAALMQAYTHAEIWDERLFRSLSAAVRRLDKTSIQLREIARLVSAFAQVETRVGSRLRDGALFMYMSSIVKGRNVSQLAQEPRTLANIVNAFAKARVWDEDLFRFLSRAARLTSATTMLPSDCGALVGSFAKAQSREGARLKDGALFRRMSLIIQQSPAESFTPRAIANIASGYAHAGINDARLLQRIARLACGVEAASFNDRGLGFVDADSLGAFKTQELASLSWALARCSNTLGYSANGPPVLLQLQQQAAEDSLGTKGGDDYQFYFRRLAAHVQRRGLASFKAQELSTLLWSFATAAPVERAWIFEMGEKELKTRGWDSGRILPSFNPHDITILAWAFAGSYRSPAVMRLLMQRALSGSGRDGHVAELSKWSGWQLATFAMSMAKSGVRDSSLWDAIRQQALQRRLMVDRGLWMESPSAALLQMRREELAEEPDTGSFSTPEFSDEAEALQGAGVQRAGNWLRGRLARRGMSGEAGPEGSGASELGQRALSLKDLINILWAATLARRMQQQELDYLLDSTEKWLESLPLPLLVQLGHILLGNTNPANRSSAAACHSCVLEASSSSAAPSITGYLDAALAVNPFENGKAADYSVQLLLALRRMERRAAPFSSKLHQSVSETLSTMGILHVNEVPVFGGVYHLDIVLSNAQVLYLRERSGPTDGRPHGEE
jgi:hypothetical protein